MKKLTIILLLTAFSFSASANIFDYIQDNSFSKILKWIDTESNMNVIDYTGLHNTPLIEISHKLSKGDHDFYLKVARLMLKKGANPNLVNMFKSSALFHATRSHHSTRFIELLMQYNGDINYIHSSTGGSLLHAAMENRTQGAAEIVSFLIENNLDVNLPKTGNVTPLMLAISSNCRQYQGCGFSRNIIKILIEAKANVNAQDALYFTPLMYAVDNINEYYTTDFAEVEMLLKAGAKVDKYIIEMAQSSELVKLLQSYTKR